jgi:hypothetical protein
MASTGTALHDDEFVSYILAELDEDYDSVYSAVISRVEPITPGELYAQLLGYEQHLQLHNGDISGYTSSANSASRGRGMLRGRSGGRHVAEVGADLVACHAAVPTPPVPAPTLALVLSAKYASR